MNVTCQIIESHLKFGSMKAGAEIGLAVDQTLTQDALGMLCYIALESVGVSQVKTSLSVSYIDHNMISMDHRNPDDHLYLQSVAEKYGIVLSRAGNGICHLVHLGRFARPGQVLLGTDSHTPSVGAAGMLGIGAGGIDVAAAMAGYPHRLQMPEVWEVRLQGKLPPGVSAKDAALWLVGAIGVSGGKGKVLEYTGSGLDNLSIPQRMTLANMGVETGATASVFPSDAVLARYLAANGRPDEFVAMSATDDAMYDGLVELNLSEIAPMVALPHQPDNVCSIAEAEKVEVDQVYIGSCTNSSYSDLRRAALVLRGRTVSRKVSLVVSPGSRRNFRMLIEDGSIDIFLKSGARILECGCGPCVGAGQAIRTGGVSVRTSNRNFKGRSGTADSFVYLTSTESAAACAVEGRLTAAAEIMDTAILAAVEEPSAYEQDDALLTFPSENGNDVHVTRGPNIKPMPVFDQLPNNLKTSVIIKLSDNVSTDEIAPAGLSFMSLRANIPSIAESTFMRIAPDFAARAKLLGDTVIIAGSNYGQGSSREHAAILPRYLGIRVVIAKSIARIHRSNLINYGVLPLIFENETDYALLEQGDAVEFENLLRDLELGYVVLTNRTRGVLVRARLDVTKHEAELLRLGGLLNKIRATY